MGATVVVLVAVTGLVGTDQRAAYADASAPPAYDAAKCPPAQAPPPGYPNPPPTAANPFVYAGFKYAGFIPYEIPFRGTIGSAGNAGGKLTLQSTSPTQPSIVVPHIYASVCGVVSLPQLVGTIPIGSVNIASSDAVNGTALPNVVNVYIGGVEALPAYATFGNLTARLVRPAAANGGLDLTINGSTTASLDATGTPGDPNTLGTNCPLTIPDVPLTTLTSGSLQGQPLTGPFHSGVAMAVGNDFSIPTVKASASCPPALAQTVNKFLNLPARAGLATLAVPVTFNFEVEQSPPFNKDIINP